MPEPFQPDFDEEFQQQLRANFVTELAEHAEEIKVCLAAIEDASSADDVSGHLRAMMTRAHALKGAAAAVDVPAVREAMHAWETRILELTKSPAACGAAHIAACLRIVDALERAGDALASGSDPDKKELRELTANFPPLGEAPSPPDTRTESAVGPESAAARVPTSSPPVRPQPASTPRGETVRVPAGRLDALLHRSGELLVARQRQSARLAQLEEFRDDLAEWVRSAREDVIRERRVGAPAEPSPVPEPTREADRERELARLGELARGLDRQLREARQDLRLLGSVCESLESDVHDTRLLEFSSACTRLDRVVRELADGSDKSVRFELVGGSVRVDRSVVEGLRAPLLQMVRNAVDHGIERPEERRRFRKPTSGVVRISAAVRGTRLEIMVEDDGRGVAADRVAERLRDLGEPVPDDPRELLQKIFQPGFSTADSVTDVSGRGFGMEVVRSQIERLYGEIDVDSEAGRGTRFRLTVPLTVATLRMLFVRSEGRLYAIPSMSVDRLDEPIVAAAPGHSSRQRRRLEKLPRTTLAEVFARAGGFRSEPLPAPAETSGGILLSLSWGPAEVGVLVDEVAFEHRVVVKPFGARLSGLRLFAGATLLPTGELVPVLSVGALVPLAHGIAIPPRDRPRKEAVPDDLPPPPRVRRVLCVDDSSTTRTLIRHVLSGQGYDVSTAVDGVDAWGQLRSRRFDAVVSDVMMPRMTGLELTRFIRSDPALASLPVVLVTAEARDEDREAGTQAGADAYFLKGQFRQQEVLGTLADLIAARSAY